MAAEAMPSETPLLQMAHDSKGICRYIQKQFDSALTIPISETCRQGGSYVLDEVKQI